MANKPFPFSKKGSTPKSVVDVLLRHPGLDPQSLSTVPESAHNPMRYTEIPGQARDDERVSATHSGDEPNKAATPPLFHTVVKQRLRSKRTGNCGAASWHIKKLTQEDRTMRKIEPNEPHYVIVTTRKKIGMTQVQLSQKTGIAQCDISRIETGAANPSLKTIKRLATGMGMCVKMEFLPA